MAAAASGDEWIAGVPGEEVGVSVGGVAVRLWRAVQLERFIDVRDLLTDETAPEPPYWMHLWPGALALARRLAHAVEVGPGIRVLELGCGLGLPALIAGRRGAMVVASDRQRAPLVFARRSAEVSGCGLALVQMDWSAPALRAGFDVCVGADIGYDADAEAALVAGLDACLRRDGVVWLADSVNTARTSLVERLIGTGFTVTRDDVREEEDDRPVWVRLIEARRR